MTSSSGVSTCLEVVGHVFLTSISLTSSIEQLFGHLVLNFRHLGLARIVPICVFIPYSKFNSNIIMTINKSSHVVEQLLYINPHEVHATVDWIAVPCCLSFTYHVDFIIIVEDTFSCTCHPSYMEM